MKACLRRGLLPAIVTLFLGALAFAADTPKFFEVNGELPGKDGLTVELVLDAYGENSKLATDTVRDGRFHFRVPATQVAPAYISFHEGKRWSNFMVIVEPASIAFKRRKTGQSVVSGGDYNKRLFAYHHDQAFIAADEAVWKYRQGLDDSSDPAREWKGFQNFLKRDEIRLGYLQKIMDDPSDPTAVVIAAAMMELMPDRGKAMAAVDAAAVKLGEDNPAVKQARRIDRDQEQAIARHKDAMLGESFVDFTAPTVDGRNVQLAPLVTSHRYTLLQFWASWCVPCRAEIPTLKKLQKEYAPKGLQIVSFSMDHDRYSWAKTDEQEAMPWQSVSDLLAQESPVIKAYKVTSIPANRIIDQQGRIVASNLLDEELEQTVRKLFAGEASGSAVATP